MWDLPGPGIEPVSPALAGGFPTAVPRGKPSDCFLKAALFLFMLLFPPLVCELLAGHLTFSLRVRIIWLWYFLSHDYQGWCKEKTLLYGDYLNSLSFSHVCIYSLIHSFDIYWCPLYQTLGQACVTDRWVKHSVCLDRALLSGTVWKILLSFTVQLPERVVCTYYHQFPSSHSLLIFF